MHEMDKGQRTCLWLAAAASFGVGLLLVLNDSGAGWFLIIMGLVDVGVLARPDQGLTASRPGPVRRGLVHVLVLLVLLSVVVDAVLRLG
jgi:hypothetical protein